MNKEDIGWAIYGLGQFVQSMLDAGASIDIVRPMMQAYLNLEAEVMGEPVADMDLVLNPPPEAVAGAAAHGWTPAWAGPYQWMLSEAKQARRDARARELRAQRALTKGRPSVAEPLPASCGGGQAHESD